MVISSNSLFHFTNKEALVGILNENFRVKYCKEKLESCYGEISFATPMVSFCDIPLSNIKNHINSYGNYAIGLSKSWAQSRHLNPVLYFDSSSSLLTNLHEIYIKESQLSPELTHILTYSKLFEGTLQRGKVSIGNYRYADEKEWRYVPYYKRYLKLLFIPGSDYNTAVKKKAHNKFFISKRLEFDPDDINYIIIKDEKEINEFINVLRNAKSKKYTLDQIERLMTRIITCDQILNDF
jgi:hypothetical protein